MDEKLLVKIENVYENIKKAAKKIDETEEHHPTLFVFSADEKQKDLNELRVIMLPPPSENRNEYVVIIKNLLKQFKAVAYILVLEAWISCISKDSDSGLVASLLSGEMRVSDLPLDDRNEVLMAICVEKNGKVRMEFAKIFSVKGQENRNRVVTDFAQFGSEAEIEISGRLFIRDW